MNYKGKGENLCSDFNYVRKNCLCVIIVIDVINATDVTETINAVSADF